MGIKQLMKLIVDEAPAAVKEHQLANYNGRIIAIDASMAIYQFLVGAESPSDPWASLPVLTCVGPVNGADSCQIWLRRQGCHHAHQRGRRSHQVGPCRLDPADTGTDPIG